MLKVNKKMIFFQNSIFEFFIETFYLISLTHFVNIYSLKFKWNSIIKIHEQIMLLNKNNSLTKHCLFIFILWDKLLRVEKFIFINFVSAIFGQQIACFLNFHKFDLRLHFDRGLFEFVRMPLARQGPALQIQFLLCRIWN